MSAKFEIDKDICTGCKMCVNSCFVDILRWDAKEGRPIAAYPEDCSVCFSCELACPVQAIEVIPEPKQAHPATVS